MPWWDKAQYYLSRIAIKKFIVVEVIEYRQMTSELICNAVLLQRTRQRVDIDDKFVNGSIDEFTEWANANSPVPVLLVLNSERFLHSYTDIDTTETHEKIVRRLIPGGDPDEFYSQTYRITEGKGFISIARKKHVDELLDKLSVLRSRILNVSIGPFSILIARQLFISGNTATGMIHFLNYSFNIQNGEISEYVIGTYEKTDGKVDDVIVIDNEKLPVSLIISYTTGIYFMLYPNIPIRLNIDIVSKNAEEFFFQKQASVAFKLLLGFLFFMLLVSSVTYSIYKGKYERLRGSYELLQETNRMYNSQQEDDARKRSVLQENGIINVSNVAFYADQITRTLPREIYLSKLEVHPKKTSLDLNNILFDSQLIIIEGNCYSGNELKEWINRLKQVGWVQDVVIKEFKQEHEDELGFFHLEVIKR